MRTRIDEEDAGYRYSIAYCERELCGGRRGCEGGVRAFAEAERRSAGGRRVFGDDSSVSRVCGDRARGKERGVL